MAGKRGAHDVLYHEPTFSPIEYIYMYIPLSLYDTQRQDQRIRKQNEELLSKSKPLKKSPRKPEKREGNGNERMINQPHK